MSDIFSIGFYNLENLFDPFDMDTNLDKDFTPQGKFKWNQEKYDQKIDHLSRAISKIGLMRSSKPPLLLGVCEVEKESCLKDLVMSAPLKKFNYDYVFHKSADPRGIHVALLYQKSHFELLTYTAHSLGLKIESGTEYTRDILHITGKLFGKKIHLIINHWPSRTDGTQKTDHKRITASNLVQDLIHQINLKEIKANILIMGDFNDDPSSKSMNPFPSKSFMNPMADFQKQKKGSVKFKGKWMVFDQILFNTNLQEASWFNYLGAHIFVDPTLIQKTGRFKGSPKRTFTGSYHQGGYSDHFPVFIYFENTLT